MQLTTVLSWDYYLRFYHAIVDFEMASCYSSHSKKNSDWLIDWFNTQHYIPSTVFLDSRSCFDVLDFPRKLAKGLILCWSIRPMATSFFLPCLSFKHFTNRSTRPHSLAPFMARWLLVRFYATLCNKRLTDACVNCVQCMVDCMNIHDRRSAFNVITRQS